MKRTDLIRNWRKPAANWCATAEITTGIETRDQRVFGEAHPEETRELMNVFRFWAPSRAE